MLRRHPTYRVLPIQTAQQVLRQVCLDWKSFFAACRSFRAAPRKFLGPPQPPWYKPRGGETVATFTNQQCRIKGGWLTFPKKADLSPIRTRIAAFQQVRVILKGTFYVVEIIYRVAEATPSATSQRALGIDLGVSNFATLASNVPRAGPLAIKGGPFKSILQFYHKQYAQLQSRAIKDNGTHKTKRTQRMQRKRENKIADPIHKASRAIINWCIAHDIGTIVVGYNSQWKQHSPLHKRDNQAFEGMPHLAFVQQLQYKGALAGITVTLAGEQYTSKCSFLDGESVEKHDHYAGQRAWRGEFQASDGRTINADVNAAYNILRKGIPDAFAGGIGGAGRHPSLLALA